MYVISVNYASALAITTARCVAGQLCARCFIECMSEYCIFVNKGHTLPNNVTTL